LQTTSPADTLATVEAVEVHVAVAVLENGHHPLRHLALRG
jgi:hypothetical protein